MQRLRFVGRATVSGWRWLVELSNHAGAIALVLLAVGISLFSAIKLPHWWWGPIILVGFYFVLFGEGSFRLYREAMTYVSAGTFSSAGRLDEIAGDLERLRGDLDADDPFGYQNIAAESNALTFEANRILRKIDPAKAREFTGTAAGHDLRAHIDLNVTWLRRYSRELRGEED